ncbi:pyridoxamine 5'-phosphate oxidase family protein [Sporomusa acidovorans]|uniref:Pyridoxamine 5'-phosphate oxidase N-terminal domain-containing protein n=1 Tax=Sporomusa acidovorans (strain ATCC 49682 / DSM 3132 / Mol) TaxID=1123286 RepID=A0ABZ3J1K5_SPOA4|nr:pyridoxamine 5'-phosphate oxidase family protein [Sporomusa acidovorans]OZC14443.1 pyridoxamine 5'-phosphate oxidase [Sporomusa acidovorans DSM 3132]SDF50252.1 hypothetical protein SAMN04488499_105330 [Sporomusa acidovorans]
MKVINSEIKAFLEENKMWVLASAGSTPNAVPIYFTKVLNDNKLMLVDVFMKKTLENIKSNPKVAITVFNAEKLQGYQIKGIATYITEGSLVDEGNTMASVLKLNAKGVVTVEVEKIFVTSPGPDIGKSL